MSSWSIDRIKKLSAAEIRQLRKNAQYRKREDVVAMCDEALSTSRRARAAGRAGKKPARSGKAAQTADVAASPAETEAGPPLEQA